jgi:predicted enzyme related to lactoylglutathione lyase
MGRVTGIGGVFFKAKDPKALYAWYERHLGIKSDPAWGAVFQWSDDGDSEACTAWAIFSNDTKKFEAPQALMLNFRVADLDGLLEDLKKEGVWIDPKRDDGDFGRFAWIRDPEGNRIELWEPARSK